MVAVSYTHLAQALHDTNMMQIFVCGGDGRATLTARLDNLGKGASGAALQCRNCLLYTSGLVCDGPSAKSSSAARAG